MQLGSMIPENKSKIGTITDNSFDFSPLEKRVITLEERQKYLMIALAILALYVILKK
jgi:hypothetical protein